VRQDIPPAELLIPRSNAAWIIALHRFFEVSVGILVALILAAVWPEHPLESAKKTTNKLRSVEIR